MKTARGAVSHVLYMTRLNGSKGEGLRSQVCWIHSVFSRISVTDDHSKVKLENFVL